ncbi:MAG: thioredoxin [Firmicutes bacterium HGW-Firmicutes-12]|nr:MAG: thioredoxin [Firmicutes bacterium HGW-Firmicutes-12]
MNNMKSPGPMKKWAKIIVPIAVVVIVAGIWLVKNSQEDIPFTPSNPDFALDAQEDFDLEKLKSYGLPIILDFGEVKTKATIEMRPVLEELNEESQGEVIIKHIDIIEYKSIVERYPVTVVPTQVFYDAEGKPFVPENPASYQMKGYTAKGTSEHIFTVHEGPYTKEQLLTIIDEIIK